MIVFGNSNKEKKNIARVDTDIVAVCVLPDEVNDIVEFLTAAIITRCLMEFGETPEIL